MNREFHKWYSPRLRREMELLIFGHGGLPMLVFPTSQGRYYEYEDRGMVGALADRLEQGSLQLFCVDSVDAESWYNRRVHPRDRVRRHMEYESYLLNEVTPLIRQRNWSPRLAATGCSFGGYHALNLALRHPDVVQMCVTMSGAFDIQNFLDGYYDNDCYFNCPVHFLPNAHDPWYLERYRKNWFLLATGEHDQCWNANERLAAVMRDKGMNHRLDVWGDGTGHDWPWWHKMAREYLY